MTETDAYWLQEWRRDMQNASFELNQLSHSLIRRCHERDDLHELTGVAHALISVCQQVNELILSRIDQSLTEEVKARKR